MVANHNSCERGSCDLFFFSSRRRHTRFDCDWSSDVCSSDLTEYQANLLAQGHADAFHLNQYKILERIGRGRMAGAFKAVHSLGQVVAIKVLPPSPAKSPQILARFWREARLSLRLKHPNVGRSFHAGAANGVHYL